MISKGLRASLIDVPPRLRQMPLRCPPRGSNSRLGTARRRECVPPRLRLAPLRCPPRGSNSRLGTARRRECVPPRLRLPPLRCPTASRFSCHFLQRGRRRRGAVAGREQDADPRTRVRGAVDQNLSSEFVHVLEAFVDADAHARRLCRLERLEEPLADEFFAHAYAGVCDFDHRKASVNIKPHRYVAALGGRIERVLDEMPDDVLEPFLVADRCDAR